MAVFQSESGLPSSSHFPLFFWKKTFADKLQGTESIQGKLPCRFHPPVDPRGSSFYYSGLKT